MPLELKDTQCGFKLFESAAAKRLFGASRIDGFAFDAEILFLAGRFGYRVAELRSMVRLGAEQGARALAQRTNAEGPFPDPPLRSDRRLRITKSKTYPRGAEDAKETQRGKNVGRLCLVFSEAAARFHQVAAVKDIAQRCSHALDDGNLSAVHGS